MNNDDLLKLLLPFHRRDLYIIHVEMKKYQKECTAVPNTFDPYKIFDELELFTGTELQELRADEPSMDLLNK